MVVIAADQKHSTTAECPSAKAIAFPRKLNVIFGTCLLLFSISKN